MGATEFRLAITTTADRQQAERLARELLERRLAACVNIVPGVYSIYRWQGAISTGDEQLLLIKTRVELIPPLKAALAACHAYDCPELIVFEIVDGAAPYLDWLAHSLGDPAPEG